MSTAETFGINSIGPEQIGLDITNRCNMRCRHCYNRSNDGGGEGLDLELSDVELREFAKAIKRMRPINVCFCGGEPLLRYDTIVEFMKSANNAFTRFSMVTNGYLMTPPKMRKLKECGLYSYQVSIDGEDAATHEALRGVRGGYEKAVDAIRIAVEYGMSKIAVAFTPTRFNIEQFPQVVEQMKALGVQEVRIQPLMKLGTAVKNEDIFPTEEQYHWLRGQIYALQRKRGGVAIEFGDPLDHMFRCSEIIYEYFAHLAIRSDGDIVLSAYIPVSVGNVRRHGLQQYWNSGLWKLWGRKLFKDIARFYACGKDFSRVDIPVPQIFYGPPVRLDIIDDHLLDISDPELYELYWNRVNGQIQNPSKGETDDACYLRMKNSNVDLNSLYLEFGKRSINASPLAVKDHVDELMRKHGPAEVWKSDLRSCWFCSKEDPSITELKPESITEILEFLSEGKRRMDFKYRKPGSDFDLASGVLLRAKMFFETHRYFAIRDERHQIRALFSVLLGDGTCTVAYAELLYGINVSVSELVRLVKFAATRIASDAVFKFKKLRFVLPSASFELKDELVRSGFSYEGTMEGASESGNLEFLVMTMQGDGNESVEKADKVA